MARFERIVELYRQRYQMDLRDFMRFLHEKVDSPPSILSQVQQYILNTRMKITEEDIKHYLHIVAAAQEGLKLSTVSPQNILSFNKVKFVKKTRVVDFDQIQVCKIKHLGGNGSSFMKKGLKEEAEDPSNKNQESFEVLNERVEEYQIGLESSLYQNETSVELLCEDNLMHLFEGNILHTFRDLKRTLVYSIQQRLQKEILSTKYIANYNSHKFVPGSLCLLARTFKNIPFAIFALEDESQIKESIKGCLISLQSGKNVSIEIKRNHQSRNYIEILMQNMGIIFIMREKEGIRLNFSKKSGNLNQIRSILQVDETSWGVTIDSIQYFQIQLK